jgi:protein SCO1
MKIRSAFMSWQLPFLLFGASAAAAEGSRDAPPVLRDVGFDQRLDGQVPLDLQFTDETGKTVTLADYFGQKPVILVLAYYRCPMLCTLVLNGLAQGMRDMPFSAGSEFNVLTVSFDPRETTALAAAKKKNYVASYGRAGAADGWHFLTGREDAIAKLTRAVGFRYVYDARQDQFIHTSGITILTPQGRVSRYFYGVDFPGRDLRLGLVEAADGRIGTATEQVLLYCFHYDPSLGRYSANILNLVRVAGLLTLLGTAGLLWFLVIRKRRSDSVVRATDLPTEMSLSPIQAERADGGVA